MNHIVLKWIDVDLIIILILYLLVFYGEACAGTFAFGQGLIVDVFSGGTMGLFIFLYLLIFIGIRFASRPLDLFSSGGQIAVISSAVFVKKILMVIFLHLFSMEITFSFSRFLPIVFSAICSGLVTPFVFSFMDFLNRFFIRIDREV